VFPDDQEINGEASISVKDAYIAMFQFVDAYWVRGQKRDGSVTLLRHAIEPSIDADGDAGFGTNDPAMWSDWLDAVRKAKDEGVSLNPDAS
jgi:hypothetical protein